MSTPLPPELAGYALTQAAHRALDAIVAKYGQQCWEAALEEAEQAQAVDPKSPELFSQIEWLGNEVRFHVFERQADQTAVNLRSCTHPVPPPAEPTVKQPSSNERAELIARHRGVQESGINAEMRELAKTTADMLEADATSAYDTMLEQVVIALTDENTKLAALLEQAQQVAAPALSAERAALIAELREFLAVLGACEAKRTVAMVINAINMLEDDASLINEGNKAQQVAVPDKREPLTEEQCKAKFEAWYASAPDAEQEPDRTYELSDESMSELTKDCIWLGWQAAHGITPQGDKQ